MPMSFEAMAAKPCDRVSSNNPYGIDFMGYDAVCRSEFIREAFVHSRVFADKSAPTGSGKPTSAISPSLLRDSAASKTGRPPLSFFAEST
jgi:hypothetical protein